MSTELIGMSFLLESVPGLQISTVKERHCYFIGRARQGDSLCVPTANMDCPFARFVLGVDPRDLPRMADTVVGWNAAASKAIALKFLDGVVRIDPPYQYIAYFPYPADSVEADILLRVCRPEEAQKLALRYLAATGERVVSPICGLGAACGECTAYVLKKGVPVVSVACNGSRPRISMAADELLVAAPFGSRMYDILAEACR